MSTEKSLLTIESINFPTLTEEQKQHRLYLPMGVSETGDLETVHLGSGIHNAHACLFGAAGSGRSKAAEFMVKALCELYGSDITISYVDGESCEVKYWKNSGLENTNLLCGCESLDAFNDALIQLEYRLHSKKTATPDIVVFDAVDRFLLDKSGVKLGSFDMLYNAGPSKNIHILYTSQLAKSACINVPIEEAVEKSEVRCATRVSEAMSVKLFLSNIATREGGMKRYGELVYRDGDVNRKVRVPFCSYHKER